MASLGGLWIATFVNRDVKTKTAASIPFERERRRLQFYGLKCGARDENATQQLAWSVYGMMRIKPAMVATSTIVASSLNGIA